MKNKLTSELAVCGINAVKALEKNNPGGITRLYVDAARAPLFGSLCKILAAQRVPYNTVTDDELQKLSGSVHHQGVAAMISAPRAERVSSGDFDVWSAAKERILVLDNVGNANNFGAIVRSAAFFGIKYIIVEHGISYLTTSSYRIAEGGMEYVTVRSTESVAALLKSAKGIITRIGTDARGDIPASRIGTIAQNSALFLVVGNEERGISRDVRAECDIIVSIAPRQADRPHIESLNVAQAVSILLYEMENAGHTPHEKRGGAGEAKYERAYHSSL
ncbi:MAG: RNA methyltransferase [Treponemataceae bacterium]|nr:MAG: RNA methyltransferase [Treponemataceae bacterium]